MKLYQKVADTIDVGDELFAYYGYKPGAPFPSDFPWYWETKLKIDTEQRKLKEIEEERKKEEQKMMKKKAKKNKKKAKTKEKNVQEKPKCHKG